MSEFRPGDWWLLGNTWQSPDPRRVRILHARRDAERIFVAMPDGSVGVLRKSDFVAPIIDPNDV